ncbi:MAG: hypothetical protein ACHBN1_33335 [Heteroscytonema crispum UTEX LB 1556]
MNNYNQRSYSYVYFPLFAKDNSFVTKTEIIKMAGRVVIKG